MMCDAKAMPGIVNCPPCEYQILSHGLPFMRCLVVVHDEGWAVLCSLTNKTHRLNQKSPELEYIYPFFLPTPAFSFPPLLYKVTVS